MARTKKMWLRGISAILFLFSILFGVTWKKTDFCLGDELLEVIGLKAWSNGTQGIHYAAYYALAIMLISSLIFSATMDKERKVFRYSLIGCLTLLAFIAMFSVSL